MQNRDQVIQHLTEHLSELEAKRNRMVQEIDKQIEHVRATIASLRNTSSTEAQIERGSLIAEFPLAKIRNMTQVQALVTIARNENDGIIRAQDAKRLLIKAGVMRETKNSTNIIHAVIVRSEKFERVRPGEYRLKESKTKASDEDQLFRQQVQ